MPNQSSAPKITFSRVNLKSESGDVPGWVLITLMTAGLVVLMWAVAGPALKSVFEQAMTKVAAF